MPLIPVFDHQLEFAWFGVRDDGPAIVMLHEGLGSVAMWKDFPESLAQASGLRVLAYSRRGHGRSSPLEAPHEPDYMHREALVELPELCRALGVENPILFGHSDGASIALIHAGSGRWPVKAVVALAPHVFVEPCCVEAIRRSPETYRSTDMRRKLMRYHDDADAVFSSWQRIWTDPRFLRWNIEPTLSGIACPVLVIQGIDDEYGTLEQVRRTAGAVQRGESVVFDECRHSPHRDQPGRTIEATVDFLRRAMAATP